MNWVERSEGLSGPGRAFGGLGLSRGSRFSLDRLGTFGSSRLYQVQLRPTKFYLVQLRSTKFYLVQPSSTSFNALYSNEAEVGGADEGSTS
jgi:hypothetical protein